MAKDDGKVMQYKIEENMKQKPAKDDRVLVDRLTTVMKKKPALKPAPKDVQSESSKMQQAEEEKQRKVDEEFENYQKGDATRLRDQGLAPFGRKKGGMIKSASARADGCAIRGKTRA